MKKQEILRAIDHAYEYHVEQMEKVTLHMTEYPDTSAVSVRTV